MMTSNGIEWSPELVPAIREFLSEDGVEFFREIRDENNGSLMMVRMIPYGDPDAFPVRSFPHSIHANEGMQVRNSIRTWYRENNLELPDDHSLDDCWEELTLEAIK